MLVFDLYTVCPFFCVEMESKAGEQSLSENNLNWATNWERCPLMHFLEVIENLFILSNGFWLAIFCRNGKKGPGAFIEQKTSIGFYLPTNGESPSLIHFLEVRK